MTPLVDMICIESQEPISKLHNVIKETQILVSTRTAGAIDHMQHDGTLPVGQVQQNSRVRCAL